MCEYNVMLSQCSDILFSVTLAPVRKALTACNVSHVAG